MVEKRFHFAGVAGSGMMPLALLYAGLGFEVSGADRGFDAMSDDPRKAFLLSAGVAVVREGECPRGAALVASTAIEKSHPDLARAASVMHRSDALVKVAATVPGRTTIMIAGSSGKTTTTAMIGWILRKNGLDPLVYVGGEIDGLAPAGARAGGGPAVIEVDESDGSIEKFSAEIGVITSVTEDHKPLREIERLFAEFAMRSRKVIVSSRAAEHLPPRNLTVVEELPAPATRLLGDFNRINEALAVRAARLTGIEERAAIDALGDFPGVDRRLQVLFNDARRMVIDDFAHNPEKISAALKAIKGLGLPVSLFFQPHGFGPTKMHYKAFGRVFSEHLGPSDRLYLLPIFYAGGTADMSISSRAIADETVGVETAVLDDKEEAYEAAIAHRAGVVVVMGARDLGLKLLARRIASAFAAGS